MANDYPGIAVVGPTASGKTRLALALAPRFHGEIVSCDALQVYKHMDIGTAKASPIDRQSVRHHMLDIRDPGEDFSSGDYQRAARRVLEEIRARGAVPFVVGGSGFYLRSLIDGLFDGPSRSEALRARMRRIVNLRGPQILHRALGRVDPPSARRISATDTARIIRAYEVYLVTGKPMSWWQAQPRDSLQGYRWLKLGIDLPREELYERINRRVEEMFRGGLLEEVQWLLGNYPRACQAFKAIGYRQAAGYIEGRLSLGEAIEETKMESRRYAKRQRTWFRSDTSIVWLDGRLEFQDLLEKASGLITEFLDK